MFQGGIHEHGPWDNLPRTDKQPVEKLDLFNGQDIYKVVSQVCRSVVIKTNKKKSAIIMFKKRSGHCYFPSNLSGCKNNGNYNAMNELLLQLTKYEERRRILWASFIRSKKL